MYFGLGDEGQADGFVAADGGNVARLQPMMSIEAMYISSLVILSV